MADVKLYGRDLSHYVVKARRVLAYKRVPHEFVYVPVNDHQSLLAVSGQDYIPYLSWGAEGATWDKLAEFVESKVPTPTLYPTGRRHLARMLEAWAHETVEEWVWRIVVPDARATFQDPREAWVFEELQRRKRGDLDELALRKPQLLRALVDGLGPAEARLGEAPFLVGTEPSIADLALYGAISLLPRTKNGIPRELPNLRAWYARVDAL